MKRLKNGGKKIYIQANGWLGWRGDEDCIDDTFFRLKLDSTPCQEDRSWTSIEKQVMSLSIVENVNRWER